jgi:hypothetical protein
MLLGGTLRAGDVIDLTLMPTTPSDDRGEGDPVVTFPGLLVLDVRPSPSAPHVTTAPAKAGAENATPPSAASRGLEERMTLVLAVPRARRGDFMRLAGRAVPVISRPL